MDKIKFKTETMCDTLDLGDEWRVFIYLGDITKPFVEVLNLETGKRLNFPLRYER